MAGSGFPIDLGKLEADHQSLGELIYNILTEPMHFARLKKNIEAAGREDDNELIKAVLNSTTFVALQYCGKAKLWARSSSVYFNGE